MEDDISFGSNNQDEIVQEADVSEKQYFKDELVKLDFSSYSSHRLAGHRVGNYLHSTYYY